MVSAMPQRSKRWGETEPKDTKGSLLVEGDWVSFYPLGEGDKVHGRISGFSNGTYATIHADGRVHLSRCHRLLKILPRGE